MAKALISTWTVGGALVGYLFRGSSGALVGFILGYILEPERKP